MTMIFDLRSGVSGDMLLGAMFQMYEGDRQEVLDVLVEAASVLSPTRVWIEDIERMGQKGLKLNTEWDEMRYDNTPALDMMSHLSDGLGQISANDRVARMSRRILLSILEAEMTAHQCSTMEEVHLHEAGTPDTIVDAVGISILFDKMELDGEWVKATPISLGAGTVMTSHGELEVPVPAVRPMIRHIPVRSGPMEGELATPTGVAAVSAFVDIWMGHEELGDTGEIPGKLMGLGAGTREYPSFPNMLGIWEVED